MENQMPTRRRPQQARALHKVELILEAAMQLLETCEIDELTTNAVAAKAGVSIGTLYQYFDSKHALLDGLVTCQVGAMTDKIVQALKDAKPTTPGERIREIVRAVATSYGGRDRVHRLLMEYSASRHARSGRLAPFFAELLDEAVAGSLGGARKLTPAEAFVVIYAITGVLRTMAASEDPPPLAEVEDALVRLVMGFTGSLNSEGV
jgi:AcrR family transcriptional regulator